MAKPITVNIDVTDSHFDYSERDAMVLAEGCRQALRLYVDQHGDLDAWSLHAEPVELTEWSGVRLVLEGESNAD